MKIICCGFWKTGTKSLADALRILGYRVYDFDELLLEFPNLWSHFFDGSVTDDEIRETLKDVDVIIDGPTVAFWYEVYKCFPEAKLILSIRDEDSWYKSYKRMRAVESSWLLQIFLVLFRYLPAWSRFWKSSVGILKFCVGETTFKDNPRLYTLKYDMHNTFVRSKAPKDKLLEFQVSDGWNPLCKFLNVENIPDVPYPFKNKGNKIFGEEMSLTTKNLLKKCAMQLVVFGTVLVGGIALTVHRLLY